MIRVLVIILLTVLACSICHAVPSSLPSLTIPDCLGVNIHFSGRQQAQVDQIADGGFRFIRMDFVWGAIETQKGVYNFASYDALVDSLASRGVRAFFILGYGNGLYGSHPNTTDDGRAAFAAFAKASAAHFKSKGVIWEIWNEPNRECWGAKPNPEDYVELAKAVYPAVKEADPNALVAGPALNRWDYGYLAKAIKSGLLNYIDILSLHPYDPAMPEDAIVFYSKVRSIIRKYDPQKIGIPIISGEWGYNTSKWGISLDKQAEYLSRMFLTNIMCGCRLNIWYDWRNDGTEYTNGEHNYGVVYNDFKEKPAYVAMKTLSTQLKGYTFVKRLQAKSDEDYLVLFRKENDYRLAAWTTAKPHAVSIPIDVQGLDIVSLLGEKKQVETNGTLRIDLESSVQYIEPSKPSNALAAQARKVVISKTELPWMEVLAPVEGNLLIEVRRPAAQLRTNFKGKVFIGGTKGIKTASDFAALSLAPSQDRAIIRIKIDGPPAPIFSFGCTLIDQNGRKIASIPAKRYSIVETFADGKPGDQVTKYNAEFTEKTYPSWSDNSKDAKGMADLTYVKAPQQSPMSVCAKLDYLLTNAKCTALVTPATPIKQEIQPTGLKAWIKGDGNDGSLRLEITDARDEVFQPDCGLADFTDWRCVTIDMTSTSGDHWGGTRDGRMECPLTWSRLLLIDNLARDIKGSVYLGPMMLCYE
ncbi:MAG: cellulase family glycosylhydrolase [Armatimonadota bacterium]